MEGSNQASFVATFFGRLAVCCFLFTVRGGHCSYDVYPRSGYDMTQVRILETCNFSYPLSIHSTSSRCHCIGNLLSGASLNKTGRNKKPRTHFRLRNILPVFVLSHPYTRVVTQFSGTAVLSSYVRSILFAMNRKICFVI